MSDRRASMWKAARVAYLVALGGLLAWLVWTRRDDLTILVEGTSPAWLAAGLLLAIGQILPSVLFWTLALRELGDRAPVGGVLSATARSVPARYVPGSVWYALGRAGLLRREHGVAKRSLAAVAGLEATLGIVIAIGLGSALLAGAGRVPGAGWWLAWWFLLLAAAGSPPAVNAALRWIAERRGGTATTLGWGAWGRLSSVLVLHWVWSAATFTAYLHAFPGLRTIPVVEVAGAFLVGWAIGFLAVFAPQGAGVFEAAVAAMLVGEAIATAAIVVAGYRALVLVRDAIVFAAASLWPGAAASPPPPASPPPTSPPPHPPNHLR